MLPRTIDVRVEIEHYHKIGKTDKTDEDDWAEDSAATPRRSINAALTIFRTTGGSALKSKRLRPVARARRVANG